LFSLEPASRGAVDAFTLYVEGPSDRSILRGWAHRLMPTHVRPLLKASVILGGRQPIRALDHFRGRGGRGRALCVLDHDDSAPAVPCAGADRIEFFTWSRRHIESYLLVPAAIRRAMGLAADDRRIERILARELPDACDEGAWSAFDAKRALGPRGPLALTLGRPLPLARIARATRESELHGDVHALFDSLREKLGPPRPRLPLAAR
jgi:hypothetical protein